MSFPIVERRDLANRFCWDDGVLHTTYESHTCGPAINPPEPGLRACYNRWVRTYWDTNFAANEKHPIRMNYFQHAYRLNQQQRSRFE